MLRTHRAHSTQHFVPHWRCIRGPGFKCKREGGCLHYNAMSVVPLAGMVAGDPDDFLDQYIAGSGINYLSPLPLDLLRRICSYLDVCDVGALALTCRRLRSAADSDEVWKSKVLAEFWSEADGKPPADWKLYFRHWWDVSRYWRRAGVEEMSFTYSNKHWAVFSPDRSGFIVCDTTHNIRTTRYVSLRKAKTYTLGEANEPINPVAPAPVPPVAPVHAWSKHMFAVADDPEAPNAVHVVDVGEGATVAPPPPLQSAVWNVTVSVTALLFAGSILVIGHNTGAIRAYSITSSASIHPVVPFLGTASSLPIRSFVLLEPGRIAALSAGGIRVWSQDAAGFRCTQVIDVAPLALAEFVESKPGRFVSFAGRSVQTWELAPALGIASTLDLSTVAPRLQLPVSALATDTEHALVACEDCVFLLRLGAQLQLVSRIFIDIDAVVTHVSLDGPIAAVVYWHAGSQRLAVINVYSGAILRKVYAGNTQCLLLSGKDLALVDSSGVKVWKENHVVPNKRMRVEQQVRKLGAFI